MGKGMIFGMVVAFSASGCAAIYGPNWDPQPSASEAEETDEVDEGERDADGAGYDEVDPFGTDPDVPDPDEPAEDGDEDDASKGSDEGAAPPASTKKGCAGLDESACKITVGCVWDSVKNCVDE